MPQKAYFDKKLSEIRQLIAGKDLGKARDMLTRIAEEPDQHWMGELTALGLPRRLHAVHLTLSKAEKDAVRRTGYQYLLVPPPDVLEPYGRFTTEERRSIAALNRQPVPRTIHQIWIGNRQVPVSTRAWAEHARKNGIEYRLWREADLDDAGVSANPVFAAMLEDGDYPGAVDIARYVILSHFGGIYLDCDFYPARDDVSFFDMLPMIGLTAFGEDVPRKTGQGSLLLANSFIATPPGHPVFQRMLQSFPEIFQKLPRAPAWWATGPLIFTVVARGAGAVSLADGDFIRAALADRSPLAAVEDLRLSAGADDGGLLIAWKSW